MKTLKNLVSIIAIAVIMNFSVTNTFGQDNQELINTFKENTNSVEKKAALNKLSALYSDEKIDSRLTNEYSNLIFYSKNNLKAIEYAVELTTTTPKNAEIFLCIAMTAANSNIETPVYKDLLELALLKYSEISNMINKMIIENTVQINTNVSAEIKEEINKIKNKPEFKSAEENL